MDQKYIGRSFDDFLAEEGLLEESEAAAVKTVLAYQISELMRAQNISKSEMARRMNTRRASLESLLDPDNHSITLHTMDKAARSLGKRLHVTRSEA